VNRERAVKARRDRGDENKKTNENLTRNLSDDVEEVKNLIEFSALQGEKKEHVKYQKGKFSLKFSILCF